jgi:tetratricopeptide (TPR) repeat protein
LSGQPAKTYLNEEIAYLGDVMCELGYVSSDQLAQSLEELALAKARGPALLGQVLLASHAIDDRMLETSLREQVARKLEHCTTLPPQSAFAYYDLFDGLRGWGGETNEGFDPIPMMSRMLRANTPQTHLDAVLHNMGASPIRMSDDASFERLCLDTHDLAAAERLREGPMRLAEFVARSGLAAPAARLLVYLLLITRQIDVVRPESRTTSGPLARPSPLPPRPSVASQTASPAPPAVAASPAPPPVAASPAPPPVAASPAPPAVATTPSPRPRQPSIPDGAAPPIRRPTPPAGLAAQLLRNATPTPGRVSPSASGLSKEVVARRDEILARASNIERIDHFTLLGVSHESSKDEIEAAFLTLAKKWHPDRLPAELALVRDACARVFSRMSEARAALTDPAKRESYLQEMNADGGMAEVQEKVAKVIEAATSFQKAEVCFKRGDLAHAEAFCRAALDGDPTQSDYLALMAWLLSLKPEYQSQEMTQKCVAMLTEAIRMNANAEKARYWRGMLLRRLGKGDAAMRDFKRAMEINPRNIDATREIRLYRMRGGRLTTVPPKMKSDPANPRPRSSPAPTKSDEPKETKEGKAPGILDRFFKR